MADVKISALPAATTPLAGTEVLPIVQGSTTDKVSVANLTAGRSVSVADLTATTGNLVIGTSGKGIDFSATAQPAGMTSELLADYEEGTWTPFIDSSTAGTGRACSGTGRYVKVGNTVFLSCVVSLDTVGTGGSGNLVVTGLPYNTVSDASLYWSGSVGNCSGLASPLTIVGTYMRGSINRFTLVGSNGSSANPLLTTLAFSTYAAAGLTLILSISYQVS